MSHRKAILDTWKAHPGFGPNQVRNTLRRERSLTASVTTVRAVIDELPPSQASEPPSRRPVPRGADHREGHELVYSPRVSVDCEPKHSRVVGRHSLPGSAIFAVRLTTGVTGKVGNLQPKMPVTFWILLALCHQRN